MKLLSRVGKLFVFAAVVLTLLFSSAFLPSNSGGVERKACAASAGYKYSRYYTYYSDASLTTEIGTRYINCAGRATTTGSTSSYFTSEIIDICCGNVPC